MGNETSIPSHNTVTLGLVEGDLEVGSHTIIKGSGIPPAVVVSGTVYCEGHNVFECSLKAESLEAEDSVTVYGDLEVQEDIEVEQGSLKVRGKLRAGEIEVDNAIFVVGDLAAQEVDVGGNTGSQWQLLC